MNILVTGGAGFIGSNLVDRLIKLGYKTIVVDNLSSGNEEYVNEQADFYQVGLTSSRLEDIFAREDITHVVHHAAQIDVQKSLSDPVFDARNNIIGTLNLLDCCVQNEVKKIVYASSAAVYGEPEYLPVDEKHPVKAMSPYGISKHTPEHYLKMYSQVYELDYTILRYSNVYGPRQDPKGEGGVVSIFVDQMLTGEPPVIYGDGSQTRDFIFVEDIVAANIAALKNGDGELINISRNRRNSIDVLQGIINDILGTGLTPIYKEERDGDIKHSILDNSRAREVLDWTPEYNLYTGLVKTIVFYARELGLNEVAASIEESEWS